MKSPNLCISCFIAHTCIYFILTQNSGHAAQIEPSTILFRLFMCNSTSTLPLWLTDLPGQRTMGCPISLSSHVSVATMWLEEEPESERMRQGSLATPTSYNAIACFALKATFGVNRKRGRSGLLVSSSLNCRHNTPC